MIDPKPTTQPTTMNETNTPEPIAAILAEMRNDNIPRIEDEAVIRCMLHNLADRIEAAAEREREEAKNYFAKLHDGPSMICTATNCAVRNIGLSFAAPGNAAAMRDALEWAAQFVELGVDDELGADGQNLTTAAEMARAALSAPARNCDRFQTAEEAVAAFADHLRAWENAHGIHSEYPDHPVQVPAGAFAWLFAPAEGGRHD